MYAYNDSFNVLEWKFASVSCHVIWSFFYSLLFSTQSPHLCHRTLQPICNGDLRHETQIDWIISLIERF